MAGPRQISDYLVVRRFYECEDCALSIDEPEGDNGTVTTKMARDGWQVRINQLEGEGGLICPECVNRLSH